MAVTLPAVPAGWCRLVMRVNEKATKNAGLVNLTAAVGTCVAAVASILAFVIKT